jgi:hypothetical protein
MHLGFVSDSNVGPHRSRGASPRAYPYWNYRLRTSF